MEKTGRNALFQAAPSSNGTNNGNDDGIIILEDWAKILTSAVAGDTSARIDLGSVDRSLKPLGETLNSAIEKIAEVGLLRKQAELFIKQNPQAIAVLGPDKSRIDLNKEYERVWRGSYEELMAKKLYDFDITMTGGDDFYASYETKRLAVSDMELKWPNGEKTYVRLYQVPILDDNGNILVNYYIYQDLTKDVSVEKYLNHEVEKLKANLEMFARGDLTFNSGVEEGNEYTTVVRDDFVQINGNIDGVRDAVGSMLSDVGLLSDAAVEGRLDTRVDASAHEGEFAQVIQGVNNTLDAVIGPLNVAAEYIDRISKGDIPEKVTDDMQGDFNEIKNNLNACIDGLGGLVEANAVLQKMADNDYTEQVAGDYQGVYAEVASATNDVQDRLVHIQDIVHTIAKGDLHELDTIKGVGKRSENDRMVPSLIGMMENIQSLVDDANLLAEAGVKGHLDVRADATRHAGAYREVITGINDTLDAMVGPLNVAAEYIDRISKGDIPEKVTDDMQGDFNEIKNNLNQCIDGLGGLVEANAVLQRMAVNDYTVKVAGDYQGVFAEVASATNDVEDRLIHVQDIMHRIAGGDLHELDTIRDVGKRSENDRMLPSIINMMENLQALVDDANMLAEAGVNGHLDVRADATRHAGAYGEVISGINDNLDAVVGPLNVAAEYIDRISKGDIPEKVTDDMQGDFNEIKNNLNQCIDALRLVTQDVELLVEAGTGGALDVRADPTRHQGVFAEYIVGFNATLDGVVGPLNVAAEYIDRISKGDIPGKVTDDMQGDFNEIKNNLNQCIDALNLINEDVGLLVEAGATGDLSVRADPARHQGVFAEFIIGFNNTLDASGAPLGETVTLLERMAVNDYTKRIETEYPGDYARVTQSVNEVMGRLVNIQNTVQHISAGDLSDLNDYKALGKRSDNDMLNPSIIGMIESLQAVVNDANMLANAGVAGQLDVRADVMRHAGAYGDVIGGINNCLDAIVGPLNVSAEYVDRISKGDIPEKITDAYAGDFNEIKNNLNGCIDAVNLLLADANTLAEAGVAGQLDVRADVKQHAGAYGEVIGGINNCLDAIIGPLNVSAEYVDRISKGDIPEKITDAYAGDFNEIKNNLNGCIDAVNLLLADANTLAEAGVAGQLDVRADVKQHAGAYGDVIGGINNCLDAIVGPLNVSAEYVDRISKGDIPEKITDAYAGDFNEIKNNLNGCIDAVNLLVVDTNMLVDAASAGKLTARADVSRHAGDYARIVQGINQTLDVIVEPFREVNTAIAQLDVTTDETTRGADEIAKAVEQVAVTSQVCADLGNSLITQIERVDRQVSDLSASNEEIASTSQEVHEHAVQTAEIGEKAQKLGAEANAKMSIVEGIAKQSVDGIENLNSRMQEIDNVVKQVNGITNQINLLALNAAIEAARTGEHGRGFAVVAGEVRNLAEEAKAATGQIDQVIAGVQAISAKTAEAIGSAHAEIGSGVASVNETIEALNEIVKGSQDMRMNLDEIAKAIEDQANMANHIVEAMEESSRLTRENQGQVEELASLAEEASASTEEIGSSIHEVKNMAGDLKKTMDKFEV